MIDISKLKELVALMAEHDLAEVEVKNGEESITVKRGVAQAAPIVQYAAPAAQAAPSAQAAPAAPPAPAIAPGPTIDSPMVGTCYLAANPDSPPFIKVGQQVTPDTTVCLIEAMKVFNEIKAEKTGVVEQVFTKTGQAVEFGQKLFALRAEAAMKTLGLRDLFKSLGIAVLLLIVALILVGIWFIVFGSLSR